LLGSHRSKGQALRNTETADGISSKTVECKHLVANEEELVAIGIGIWVLKRWDYHPFFFIIFDAKNNQE